MRRVAPQKVRWQDLSPDARRRLLEPVVSPEFRGGVPDGMRAGSGSAEARRDRPDAAGSRSGSCTAASSMRTRARSCWACSATSIRRSRGRARRAARRRDPRARVPPHVRRQPGQVYVLPTPRAALLAEFAVFAGLGDFDEFGHDAQAYAAENVIRAVRAVTRRGLRDRADRRRVGQQRCCSARRPVAGVPGGPAPRRSGRVVRRITICELDARKFASLRSAMTRLAPKLGADDFDLVVDEEDSRPPRRTAPRRRGSTGRPIPCTCSSTSPRTGAARFSAARRC
jgi:hypothetical protein